MLAAIDFDQIDITGEPPVTEPERQYYFIAKARKLVALEGMRLGRQPACAVITFGCQMNTEVEIEKAA